MSETIRFRCASCNATLKIPGSKVGAKVACPRCKHEQTVPAPAAAGVFVEESEPGTEPPSGAEAAPPRAEPAGLPVDLAAIVAGDPPAAAEPPRPPEGFLNLDLRLDAPPAPPAPAPAPAAKPVPPPPPAAKPSPPSAPPVMPVITTAPIAMPAINTAPIATPAEPATPSLRAERATLRPRDVNLPRTAVVAWTTMVLLAQLFAFAAGLLIGHFLWR